MLLTERYDLATSGAALVSVAATAAMGTIRKNVRANHRVPSPPDNGEEGRVLSLAAQASLLQSRGVIFFSLAYAAADCSTIDRTSSRSGWIQSVITFHWLPSHCWNLTAPPPSWSAQVTFSDCMNPAAPSSLRRASLICRFSMPQRICSPVSGFLPYFSCALR